MSQNPTMDSMRQLLIDMREQLHDLSTDNAEIRREIKRLRAENETLRAQRPGPLGGETDAWYSFEDADTPDLSRTVPGWGETPRFPRTSPPSVQARAPQADHYARSRRQGVESAYYGRGLEPERIDPSRLTPRPDPNRERPRIDLGYVNSVSATELDVLPYGLIVLDARGTILFYNETEGRYAGYDPQEVTGKNFFGDVAPCTRVKEFQGRFEDFVDGKLGRVTFFDFAFFFEHGTQSVVISLSHGRVKGHYNVMMVRK